MIPMSALGVSRVALRLAPSAVLPCSRCYAVEAIQDCSGFTAVLSISWRVRCDGTF